MISDLVGTFTDPIIVYPGGWGDTLPDWIRTQITLERLIENMKEAYGEQPTGTDAEATAYLYTASLTAPMSDDWTKIYLHVAGKTYAPAPRAGARRPSAPSPKPWPSWSDTCAPRAAAPTPASSAPPRSGRSSST
jgi:hypothetical protein